MQLEDLAGEHELTGVDLSTASRGKYDDYPPNTITFVLDGKAYRVTEDPSDGYRSAMRDIEEVPNNVSNVFAPVKVIAAYVKERKDRYSTREMDVLEVRDVANGALILEVGTDNSDDYYPSFVGSWMPEKMTCNAKAAVGDRLPVNQ